MNAAKRALVRTQKFVNNNKVPIAVGVTTAVTGAVFMKVAKGIVVQRDEFLAEHGLLEKFYETLNEL